MKLKQLEMALQDVDVFEQPKINLEQYPTTPHLAACVLFEAQNRFEDIEDRSVCDLGCGTGMLSIGAGILGAGYVCGVDIDCDALAIAARNIEEMEVDVELVQSDLTTLCFATTHGVTADAAAAQLDGLSVSKDATDAVPSAEDGAAAVAERANENAPEDKAAAQKEEGVGSEEIGSRGRGPIAAQHGKFDTVLMNPPFGTRCKGIDMLFLLTGVCLARRAVYSMHKIEWDWQTSTREHISKKAAQWNVGFQVIAQLNFDVPAMYDFHRKDNVVIQVDLIRLQLPPDGIPLSAMQGLVSLSREIESNRDLEEEEEEEEEINATRKSTGRGRGGGRGGPGRGGGGGRGGDRGRGRGGRGRGKR